MREIKFVVEEKIGRTYEVIHTCNDEKQVYEDLAHELIAKKINQCTYIRSIKRHNNYDGTENITVSYDNNVRRIYTIKCH